MLPIEVIWRGAHYPETPGGEARSVEAVAPPAPLEAVLSWLLIHAWNWAGGTTWTVERISECPTPQSRLQTTG